MFFALLYAIGSPVLWFFAWLGGWCFKKARHRLIEEKRIRKVALTRLRQLSAGKEVLIFHAASAGEFEQLKPLLPKIDRQRFFIVQTFYSHTIYTKEKDSQLFDVCCYHPLDSALSAYRFFRSFRPALYILNRHDLWPAHILVAKLLGIKTVLINANLHSKSHRFSPFFRSINRWMFESFDAITCGSQRLQKSIEDLAPKAAVHLLGETRFERVLARAKSNPYNHFSYDVKTRKNIVFGSSIASDYEILCSGVKDFINSQGSPHSYRIIVVPHEVDSKSIEQLEERLALCGFSSERYTDESSKGESQVVIVDVVGILAELYGYAYVAYVGAGFGAGVHSVIEPAAYGIPVFYGPNYHILDEAIEMVENGSGTVVTTAQEVTLFLEKLEDVVHYDALATKTQNFVETMSHCTDKIEKLLVKLVDSKERGKE